MKTVFAVTVSLGLATLAGPLAAQTAANTCAKMQAENRLGLLSVERCVCHHDLAAQMLDADILALLYESWHDGVNNMDKLETLRPRSRVQKQFKAYSRAIDRECT